jgi:putative PIN family toxin of toxin-antitoxin system
MKVVLDTNVFVSGVFFTGPPFKILDAWRKKRVQLVLSPEIFDEYQRVGEALGKKFPGVELESALALLAAHAEFMEAPALPQPVCEDPDDDKFLACAKAAKCRYVVSGDKHLLNVSGYEGIQVLRPAEFCNRHL